MANDDKRSNKFWYREVTENNMESDVNYALLHMYDDTGKYFQGHTLYVLWQAIQDKAIRHGGYLAIEMGEGNLIPMPWSKIFTYVNIPKPLGMDVIKFFEGKGLIVKEEKGKFAGCYLVKEVQTYIARKQAGPKTYGAQEKAAYRSRKAAEGKAKDKGKDKSASTKEEVNPPY